MTTQVPLLVYVYFAAAVISLGIGWLAWRLRPARGAFLWSMVMLSTALWAAGAGLFSMSITVAAGYTTQIVQYMGVMGVVYFWGAFCLAYSQFDRFLTRGTYLAMAVVPLLTFIVMATSPWHSLFATFEPAAQGGPTYLGFSLGPVFWVWAGYSWLISAGGSALLIFSILRFPYLYRGQAALLMLASLIPLVLNILYLVFDVRFIGPYDPTSMFFMLAGIVILLAMSRYRFLDVVPVAHDLVFKGVRSGVVVLDERNRVMDINPAALEIAGMRADQVLGRSLIEALPEYADIIRPFRDVHEIKTEVEVDQRHYEMQVMPLTDRRGTRSGRIIMLYDITDQKRIQSELDAYARTVAHDLKDPVGVIMGWAGRLTLSYDQLTDGQRKQRLGSILNSARTINSIIDSLLLLASVRQQEEVLQFDLEMGRIVNQVLNRFDTQIGESGAKIVLPDNWLTARGHAPWVEQVWVNYISNALKYGGDPPQLTLGCAPDAAGQVRFFVRDNGGGLSSEDQERLFSGFSRLDRHASIEGHGLGLSIVQSITTKLGGSAGVESALGEGSTFYFTLPDAGSASESGSSPR